LIGGIVKISNGFYSVVQYAPLPFSDHVEIVGIILICSQPHYIGALFTLQGVHILADAIEGALDRRNQLEQPLVIDQDRSVARTVFRDLSDLKEFLSKLGRGIQLTAAERIEVVDPSQAMTALLTQYA
jgi:hypothetical protein